jgi:hypothetical protein
MKRVILTAAAVLTLSVTAAYAQFPVFEGFFPPMQNTWEQFWTVDSINLLVPDGTDGIPVNPEGSGYMIKNGYNAEGYISAGVVTGNETDNNYTLQAWVYTPVFNTTAEPDDYLYQMLIFHRDANGYGRMHTHFNEDSTIDGPRIRLQITNPSFAHTTAWYSPADFLASEGWHFMKIEVGETTATCYYDGGLLGTADWTSDAPAKTAGKFGYGQYIDGAGERYVYLSEFKAYQGTEPPDPEPPLEAQNWSVYE